MRFTPENETTSQSNKDWFFLCEKKNKKKVCRKFGIVKIKCVLYIVINHKRLTLNDMDNSTFNIENKEVKEPKKPVFELNNSFSENRFYIKSKEVIELIGRGIKKIDCQTYPSKYMVTEKALEKLREKYEMKFEPLF